MTVGTSSVISPGTSDWPESLYICPLPDQEDKSICVKVTFGELEATVTVNKGMKLMPLSILLCLILLTHSLVHIKKLEKMEHFFRWTP